MFPKRSMGFGLKIKRGLAAFAVLLMCAVQYGCAAYDNFASGFMDEASPDGAFRIGVFEPLTGKDKESGQLERIGIELAHSLYPDVLGRPIELIVSDNRSDIGEARAAAEYLADKGVCIALGSYRSTLSLAGGEVFSERGIPAISITNANPLVTNTNEYYFRVRYVEAFQGVAAAKYAAEELQAGSAAIMREIDNDYAEALCQSFSDKFISLTGNGEAITHTSDYEAGTADFAAELNAIKETGTSVIFVPSSAEAALEIARQADALGIGAIFLGTDLWEESEALLKATDSAVLSRMAFSSDYGQNAEQSELATIFTRAYKEKFGSDGEPDHAVALGFDAYMLARDAIERAGENAGAGAVRGALASTKSYPGVSGNITFDENGDPIKSVSIMRPIDGKFVNIYTAEPNWGPVPPEGPEEADE
ncbi:MAG: ABC transporter substrate-binding protein [Clostridiales Family XIII bacterium]|jgi:branched-chain amino acid transport system substrate-binding protein|nr:ABC transporter substrate-binding protein [Clostridiales Family XIII bacterium]